MKTVYLDMGGCKYIGEMHERIRLAFGFPEWYGGNWDAFWDFLRSECEVEYLHVSGAGTANEDIREELLTMENILKRYKVNCGRYGERFDFLIE